MVDIIIPSCKPIEELRQLTSAHTYHTFEEDCNVIETGFPCSAAVNRNYGLLRSQESNNEFIIMMDDDIGGFFNGWYKLLIDTLKENKDVSLVSARLMTPHGEFGPMMGVDNNASQILSPVSKAVLSACIAFRKEDIIGKIRFDENFVGSGFEDTLFCHHLHCSNPDSRFVVNNKCRLIHYHEMKNQAGKNFEHNKKHFLKMCIDTEMNNVIKEMRTV